MSLEDCISNHKPSFMEKAVDYIENKWDIEKYIDSHDNRLCKYLKKFRVAEGFEKIKKAVCYGSLGSFLPTELQEEYAEKAGCSPRKLFYHSLGMQALAKIGIIAGTYLLSSATVPTAGAITLGVAAAWAIPFLMRGAYTLATKRPIGFIPIEIPYRLGKAGYEAVKLC